MNERGFSGNSNNIISKKENPYKEGSCKFETYLSLWMGRTTEILYIQLREFALID